MIHVSAAVRLIPFVCDGVKRSQKSQNRHNIVEYAVFYLPTPPALVDKSMMNGAVLKFFV
jgi:hypothetical protein